MKLQHENKNGPVDYQRFNQYQDLIANNIDTFISMIDAGEVDVSSLNMNQRKIINAYRQKLTRRSTLNTIRHLWKYLFSYKLQIFCVLIATIFAVSFNSLSAFSTIYLVNLLNQIGNNGTSSNYFTSFSILAAVILCFYFIYAFGLLLQTRIMAIVSQKMGYKIREDLFDKIQRLPVKYFDQNSSGDLMSKFTNDVNNVTNMFSQNSSIIINGAMLALSMLISMFLLSPYMALIVVVLAIILIIPMVAISRKSQPLFAKTQKTLGNINGFIEEMISGQTIVSLFDQNENVVKKFEKINDKLIKVTRRGQVLTSFIMPYTATCLNIISTVVWISGILFTISGIGIGFKGITMVDIFGINNQQTNDLINANTISGLALTASFSIMARNFFLPFTQIGGIANMFLMALAGADRVFQVFKEKNEINSVEQLILHIVDALKDGETLPSSIDNEKVEIEIDNQMVKLSDTVHTIETNSSLKIQNLNFGYYEKKQILFNINFDVKKGQTIAIVGPTGSGKSTFINLLTKFYDITDGDILFGENISIKQITKKSIRNNVSIVLQDTFLFNESIRDNIRYGNMQATDEQVVQAAKAANAHNFIMQLPNGYDTVLKDNGEDLSQGQRQLLAIARAILSPSNILILDEATSSIDTKTEIEIQNAMLKLMENKTSFVIAHRLSTIQNADKILVLKDGKIIESGTHTELLNKRGFYYKLYNSQFYED